jgi:hypothetical protein
MLAKKDALQGKVRKTHREFVQAAKTVEIQVHRSPRTIV